MPSDDNKWIGGKAAGALLGVPYQTVRRWSDHNRQGIEIRYTETPNGRRRYWREDIENLAKKMRPDA